MKKKGHETGLNLIGLAEIMSRNAFIDKSIIENYFDVQSDDINEAISKSVLLSLDILDGKIDAIDMKFE